MILASIQAKAGAGWDGGWRVDLSIYPGQGRGQGGMGAGGLILASTQAKDGAGWEGGWMVDPSIYPGQGWGRVGGGLEG